MADGFLEAVIYVNFCHAFYKVEHHKFMAKTKSFAVSVELRRLIENFVLGRPFSVRDFYFYSSLHDEGSGVSEGSVLGALMPLFINILPVFIRSS